MLEWFGGNWGNLASVAGLVFSMLAFVFSKRASKAAKEARDSILVRTLMHDMSHAVGIASDLGRTIDVGRVEMALWRVGELINALGYLVERWSDQLSEDSKKSLARVRTQLGSLRTSLNTLPVGVVEPDQRNRMTKSCQTIAEILNSEHGKAVKGMD